MSKISPKEKIRLKTRLKITKGVDEYKRLCVILAWDRGREAVEIADFLSLPESTVYRYIREYIKNSKSHHDPKGGSTSKLHAVWFRNKRIPVGKVG
ncbi:MAG: helix-turn-helix domain-containing protein [Chlamydiota bacterium]